MTGIVLRPVNEKNMSVIVITINITMHHSDIEKS